MNYISKSIISVFIIFPSLASAGFDFGGDGGGCEGGSGDFQQQINHYGGDTENAITVGTIPKDLKDVYIALKSDKDVDIRLYNANGEKIVHWPHGLLSGDGNAATSYNGVVVEYSGYNGDGSGLGHEYIKISGTTQNDFVMKAFGYEAGYAKVDYSWAGKANCTGGSTPSASGSGDFQQQIVHQDIVTVGDIPPEVNNLYITLKSGKDVDIQLYDKDNGKKIVHWPEGILNAHDKQTTNYQGMQIEWSGYNGDGTNLGHEYIKITGKTTRNLTMKAYGYQAGYAEVHYEWGDNVSIPPVNTELQSKYIQGDEIVVDPTTGKMWTPYMWKNKNLTESREHCGDLNLVASGWNVPTESELSDFLKKYHKQSNKPDGKYYNKYQWTRDYQLPPPVHGHIYYKIINLKEDGTLELGSVEASEKEGGLAVRCVNDIP